MTEAEVQKIATIVMVSLLLGVGLGIILIRVYFSKLRQLLNYLESNYPEKWEELDNPTLFAGTSPRSAIRVIRFIFSSELDDDTQIKNLKSKARKSLVVFIVYFAIMLILVIGLPILIVTGRFPIR